MGFSAKYKPVKESDLVPDFKILKRIFMSVEVIERRFKAQV